MSILGMDDYEGWARLNALGIPAITDAQSDAIAAVGEYLAATLADNGTPDAAVVVPIRTGTLQSGQSVARFIAATRDAVGARMNAGDPFALALQGSKNVVVAVGASEPHRIGRDGVFDAANFDARFTRYRRVAEPRACKFCLMLASRGAVYLSEASAGGAKKFHSHCRCRIEAVVAAPEVGPRRARIAA